MDNKNIAKQVLIKMNGVAKTSDFIANGISAQEVTKLCNKGLLERIRHGYYQLSSSTNTSEEYLLKTLVPQGIVSLESALFHYGYSDFSPRKWFITVPRSISRAKLKVDGLPIKTIYVKNTLYDLGKTESIFNGVNLPIYDRERTICDCFKHRAKLDNEIFNKALNAYVRDNKKNLSNLSKYAKELRVYKKVMEIMEIMLNG
ncbi:MAG: type IV toxin-antitoxin system AbiEi family antitoxin domain-containing protein [Erysipelotrichaceae bacterium]